MNTTFWHRSRSLVRRGSRRGVAAVEFALCLPLIATIVFGTVEAYNMILLKQSLKVAAYEAARLATTPTATSASVTQCGSNMLTQRKVTNGTVQISPADPSSVTPGNQITVTVTAPIGGNRYSAPWFFGSGNISVTCAMLKESY